MGLKVVWCMQSVLLSYSGLERPCSVNCDVCVCVCVCVCVSLLKHYSTALGLGGRKPMWEPDPVLYCAVDCTVNTEKEGSYIGLFLFLSHNLLTAIFGLFLCCWLCCSTGNHFTVHLQF